jgi:hypothetical protein
MVSIKLGAYPLDHDQCGAGGEGREDAQYRAALSKIIYTSKAPDFDRVFMKNYFLLHIFFR